MGRRQICRFLGGILTPQRLVSLERAAKITFAPAAAKPRAVANPIRNAGDNNAFIKVPRDALLIPYGRSKGDPKPAAATISAGSTSATVRKDGQQSS